MSASESASPGGQPSTTQPIAGPCDSPKVVTVKRVPSVLPDIGDSRGKRFASSLSRSPWRARRALAPVAAHFLHCLLQGLGGRDGRRDRGARFERDLGGGAASKRLRHR